MKDKIKNYSEYKLYVILYMIAFISWLISIYTTHVTNIIPNDFLGIVSKLPMFFFVAILLTIIAMKQAHDDNHTKTFATGLLLIVIILFLTYPVIEPNASFAVSYYPSGMATQILESGHISTEFSYEGYVYLYYTGFQIFTSTLLAITNIELDFVIKYFYVFFVFIIVMFVAITYKFLSKNWNFAIIGTLLFISFFWSEQIYYGPQLFSFLLMCTLFFVFIKYTEYNNVSLVVIATLIFLSISFTHILIGLMIVIFLFVINISFFTNKNSTKLKYFFIPFTVIYITWFVNMAFPFFKYSIATVFESLNDVDTHIKSVTLGRTIFGETINETIIFNVRLFFIAMNFILVTVAIYNYLKTRERNKLYDVVIFWIVSVFLLLFISYGGEIILRIYLYSLVGSSFFITYLFRKINNSIVLFSILTLFLILNPIAFVGDESIKLVSDSEIVGSKFFVKTTINNTEVFYTGGGAIMKYLDGSSNRRTSGFWAPANKTQFNISRKYDYVVSSEIGSNVAYYYLNYDPVSEQMRNQSYKDYYILYNNMNFITYKRKNT